MSNLLNEEVSGTNVDEVSRLQTLIPKFRSPPSPKVIRTISLCHNQRIEF